MKNIIGYTKYLLWFQEKNQVKQSFSSGNKLLYIIVIM